MAAAAARSGGSGLRLHGTSVHTRNGVQRLLLWADPARRARGPFRVDVSGAMPIGGPPLPGEPEQVRVRSHSRWRLEVVPLAEVPVFDRRLAGRGAEVVRWTGPPGRLTARTGRWRGGHVEASVLDERLEPLGVATTFGRRRHEPVELPPGCLVAVQTWGGNRRWRLVVR
ncbi:hypothetical protein OHV13_17585 [Kitasatospora purpeofusca]|uniref:hypothetical protein n=1 Tax=Kitasatospora purpeofusca TaxID=67352 RepID=UPI0032549FE9